MASLLSKSFQMHVARACIPGLGMIWEDQMRELTSLNQITMASFVEVEEPACGRHGTRRETGTRV
jgi:hypothetical protein